MFREGHALILVFDLTDATSFSNIPRWLEDYKGRNHGEYPILLVGNKADQVDKRVVDKGQIDDLISSLGVDAYDAYIETSARDGENVEKLFEIAATLIYNQYYPDQTLEEPSTLTTTTTSTSATIRATLLANLTTYIQRVESHKTNSEIDFGYGFWFFKNSRAANREANYHLACQLRDELNDGASISEVFEDTTSKRDHLIAQHSIFSRPDYKNRGNNSDELNRIINTAINSLRG